MPQLKAHGINAAAITYDAPAILRNFAATYKLEYPLLSDVGSKVIRAFGIFNINIPEDHKMMYGIPWPGDYLLAPDGTVRDKLFRRSYEHRASASEVVLRHFGDAGGHSVGISTDVLDATVALSTDSVFPGQELAVLLDLKIKPGWHIYGAPLPAHYQATELIWQSPLIDEQSLELAPATPMVLAALNETLPVYAGELRALGKIHIRWSPPMAAEFLLALGDLIEPGPHVLRGLLKFQACSETVCEAPQSIAFELPLTIAAGVPTAPKQSP